MMQVPSPLTSSASALSDQAVEWMMKPDALFRANDARYLVVVAQQVLFAPAVEQTEGAGVDPEGAVIDKYRSCVAKPDISHAAVKARTWVRKAQPYRFGGDAGFFSPRTNS